MFLITDSAGATAPIAVASGDFIFVGDVGRPDLEKAANIKGTMEIGARQLYASLQRPRGRTGRCGPVTAQGRHAGRASVPFRIAPSVRTPLQLGLPGKERSGVRDGGAGGPAGATEVSAEMKRVNKEGPRILNGFKRPVLQVDALAASLAEKAIVVDTRKFASYSAGHIPGTINIPLNASFTTRWGGKLVPYDREFYLIVDETSSAAAAGAATGAAGGIDTAVRDLAMIGLDRAGYFDADVIDAWAAAERPLATVPQVTAQDLQASLGHNAVTLLDVRNQTEWDSRAHRRGPAHHARVSSRIT